MYTPGMMEEDMKVSIKMTKNMDMEFINGLMVENIWVTGIEENSTE